MLSPSVSVAVDPPPDPLSEGGGALHAMNRRTERAFVGQPSLRDEERFYGECIPFAESLTCEQVNDPELTYPATCSMQLQR